MRELLCETYRNMERRAPRGHRRIRKSRSCYARRERIDLCAAYVHIGESKYEVSAMCYVPEYGAESASRT